MIIPVRFTSQTFKIFLREFVDNRDNEMGVLYNLFFPFFVSFPLAVHSPKAMLPLHGNIVIIYPIHI